ncbi:MAG: MarR family winged helix-turn-helix transcriptional regulator [Brevundimonas sp.]
MIELSSTLDPAAPLGDRLDRALLGFVQCVDAAREKAAKDEMLHPTDFGCILLLYRAGKALSPTQIIEALNLRSSSGTALIDRMERQGYIKRSPNPDDRRSVLISLDGARVAELIERQRETERQYRAVAAGYSDSQLDTIAKFLEEVIALSR